MGCICFVQIVMVWVLGLERARERRVRDGKRVEEKHRERENEATRTSCNRQNKKDGLSAPFGHVFSCVQSWI